MREKYKEELLRLNEDLISMGKLIEVAIQQTVIALTEKNCDSAYTIMKNDDAIDSKEREIEQECIKLLLQQQPVAGDLRVITAALKMVTDMERIGDHASDIADLITKIPDFKYNDLSNIDKMSAEVISMLHNSLDAYTSRDMEKALAVIAQDDVVDDLFYSVKTNLINEIKKSENGEQILDYLMIAKYFERIGDHATNIAEWAIFSITGQFKR